MRRSGGSRIKAAALVSLLASALACSDSTERQPAKSPASSAGSASPSQPAAAAGEANKAEVSPEKLLARGRSVYMSNCAACHNQDPSQAGAVGPAIAGSSPELIEAKVVRNEYPAGYTPKRDSRAMIPLPYLAKELSALRAFLASAAPSS